MVRVLRSVTWVIHDFETLVNMNLDVSLVCEVSDTLVASINCVLEDDNLVLVVHSSTPAEPSEPYMLRVQEKKHVVEHCVDSPYARVKMFSRKNITPSMHFTLEFCKNDVL